MTDWPGLVGAAALKVVAAGRGGDCGIEAGCDCGRFISITDEADESEPIAFAAAVGLYDLAAFAVFTPFRSPANEYVNFESEYNTAH